LGTGKRRRLDGLGGRVMAWEHKTDEEIHEAILKALKNFMKQFKDKQYLLESLTYEEEAHNVNLNGMFLERMPTGKVIITIEMRKNK